MLFRLREIMLLHLFEMQDRNSAWNSLCLSQQADGNCDSRSSLASLRRHSSSPLHCNAPMQSTATAVYSHKHPELDTAACNDLNLNTDKHPNCAFHHSQLQALCGAKTKLNQLPGICPELPATIASGSQITRSEPATRSNSIDCENDIPKLPVANKISHDVESSRLRLDLIVPNGE